MTRKLHPQLSFDEISLIITVLRESKSASANELSVRLYKWIVDVIDSESSFKKAMLNVPLKDRA